jgi:hypothetical protein
MVGGTNWGTVISKRGYFGPNTGSPSGPSYCAYSDEDNQCSGLMVISIPAWCDQSSERKCGSCTTLTHEVSIAVTILSSVNFRSAICEASRCSTR